MTMTSGLVALFWLGLAGAAYAYVGFPMLLMCGARFKGTSTRDDNRDPSPVGVTVIVPAYNEEVALGAKIRNVLSSDYPGHLLDVIVVSDASTDRTNDVARGFESQGVRLIVQDERRGKTAGLNRAVATARGEIVVFTDANAEYPAETIKALARYFADPRVGLVSGYTRYALASDGFASDGKVAEFTNLYTSLERAIKRGESVWGCCVGADGAIFAMRRSLYRTLRDDDINDFVLPLDVIHQGFACLFADDAFCSEHPGKNLESEFRRQSRITNRTLRALWRNARLFNPFRFPLFSFLLFSHKVARFLVPIFLLISAASLLALAPMSPFYAIAAAAAVLGAGLALLARIRPIAAFRPASRIGYLLGAFLIINLAVLDGWWKFLSGHGDVTWQHDRSVAG